MLHAAWDPSRHRARCGAAAVACFVRFGAGEFLLPDKSSNGSDTNGTAALAVGRSFGAEGLGLGPTRGGCNVDANGVPWQTAICSALPLWFRSAIPTCRERRRTCHARDIHRMQCRV
jgi:hypothetical protein